MKRSSSSTKAVSGNTQSKPTEVPVSTGPAPVLKESKEVTPKSAPKRVKKEKTVKEEPVTDGSEQVHVTKQVTPPQSSTDVESTLQVGGEQLDAELAGGPTDDFEVRCAEYFNALRDLVNKVSDLKSEYKAIERIWTKRFKLVSKSGGKKKKKTTARAPSGFVKPTPISDELASFLGKEKGSEMARTEVTREINVYIRNNGLQDATNGRRINADPALSSLLKLAPGDELTYFNLQKYMSGHFPKAVVQPVV
jgi:chromatin remodeling complex protein RSC6